MYTPDFCQCVKSLHTLSNARLGLLPDFDNALTFSFLSICLELFVPFYLPAHIGTRANRESEILKLLYREVGDEQKSQFHGFWILEIVLLTKHVLIGNETSIWFSYVFAYANKCYISYQKVNTNLAALNESHLIILHSMVSDTTAFYPSTYSETLVSSLPFDTSIKSSP